MEEALNQEVLALRMQFIAKAKEKAAEKNATIKSTTGRKKLVRPNQSEQKEIHKNSLFALFDG